MIQEATDEFLVFLLLAQKNITRSLLKAESVAFELDVGIGMLKRLFPYFALFVK